MRKVQEEHPTPPPITPTPHGEPSGAGVFAQKLISGHQSRCEWWEADHQHYSIYVLINSGRISHLNWLLWYSVP